MQWFAQAPSNIALIKYMGKKDSNQNLPLNPSLSYTLKNLLTSVVLESHAGKTDFWEPLQIPGAHNFSLAKPAQERYLKHLKFLKDEFGYKGAFTVKSNNNFPHSSGLASSASSFAALTKCACLALSELTKKSLPEVEKQAELSRHGSGSSCRSFFAPWALWQDEAVKAVQLPYHDLLHQVIVISHAEKEVSSSEAHKRIQTSPNYKNREQRAEDNLQNLIGALKGEEWQTSFEICWKEFEDIHELFTTCDEPFTYKTAETEEALKSLKELWQKEGDGPLVTMDAGPNIHLLYRSNQKELAARFRHDVLLGNYDVI